MTGSQGLNLVVVHNHFRPGGVRRVIELALPSLAERLRPTVRRVTLAGGSPPDDDWLWGLQRRLEPVPVVCRIDPSLSYLSEQPEASAKEITARVRDFLGALLSERFLPKCVVWAHNPGLGRNLLLTSELERVCRARGVPLVFHHHDWWFDNRWQRWPELRRAGYVSLERVAAIIFTGARTVRHVAINQSDAAVLQRHFPNQSGWLPNPAAVGAAPSPADCRRARRWLRDRLGNEAPVWLMPCRLLRRKNVAEALLLTRWLRPEAWLVTTAGVTSPDEQPYADQLRRAAARHHWPLRLSILENHGSGGPAIPELLAASEAVLLTSLQEGFGLPYIEAAMARRALIARSLPNIAPDLAEWGLRFPQSYDEVRVDTALFDWGREVSRQKSLFRLWRRALPEELRRCAGVPMVLSGNEVPPAVPFSRLTLSAQLEVLAHPAEMSWSACVQHNPWLTAWRDAAAQGALGLTRWPPRAVARLSGARFARGFARILRTTPDRDDSVKARVAVQQEFIREKLQGANLYPLFWSPQT
jgi:glycosyltransferase involved in cell wall biosynthesis